MQRPADESLSRSLLRSLLRNSAKLRRPASSGVHSSSLILSALVFSTALLALTSSTGADDEVATAKQNSDAAESQADSNSRYTTRALRGQVVWMADAIEEKFGVSTVTEARERVLALVTTDGELYPIMEDPRGRSFRRDPRLRGIDLELIVRQYTGLATVQVIRTHAVEGPDKYRLDYWCDICSISMVELKVCDCCQGPTELRRRKVPANQTLGP